MRLTALCVCGTLLAFSSLSWITADSDGGVLLDLERGFGPCTATLIPKEPCRPDQHEGTCPYLFTLPPLTVQLPQQLRELEKIVQDLEKLKDSVDQLREMCADCTASQSEKGECGRKTEGADDPSWMNERLQENDRDHARQECGPERGKVENIEGDGDPGKRLTLEEKERKIWDADGESNKGVVKENEREKAVTEVAVKDGKTQTEWTNKKGKPGQTGSSGGHERVDGTRGETVADKTHMDGETDRKKTNARQENPRGYQEDKLEKGKDGKMTPGTRHKEKTEESHHHTRPDEAKQTQKKTQTEASDRIKMSEDRGEHTNMKQGERREEKEEEMERGMNAGHDNEKPKQAQSSGQTERDATVKEKEEEQDREMGKEIKTEEEKLESARGDGELPSRKSSERTDFVSVSPTPDSTWPGSSQSNRPIIFSSSLPSPPLPRPSPGSITDVSHEAITPNGPTQNTGPVAPAGFSESPNPDPEAVTDTVSILNGFKSPMTTTTTAKPNSRSRLKPGMGLQGQTSSTTTPFAPYETVFVSGLPRVNDHSRWTPKKNISVTDTKTGAKPLPGQKLKPGEKHKLKPEADQKGKIPKTDRKPDRPPFPDKKNKYDQKQKPPLFRPTTDRSRPANVPKRVQIPKPGQRTSPDGSSINLNPKNSSKPKLDQDRARDLYKPLLPKPNFHQKSVTPGERPTSHQRPDLVNKTHSGENLQVDRTGESDGVPETDQNSKSKKKETHPVETNEFNGNQKPERKQQSEKTRRPDQTFERNQGSSPFQEPESKRSELTVFTLEPKSETTTDSMEKFIGNPSHGSVTNKDTSAEEKMTMNRGNAAPDREFNPDQKIPTLNRNPVTDSMENSEENPPLKPTFNQDLTPGRKVTQDQTKPRPDQKLKPSQKIPELDQKPGAESIEKLHENTAQEPTSRDSTPGHKITPDKVKETPNQKTNPGQEESTADETPVTESTKNYGENPSSESTSNKELPPGEKTTPNQAGTRPNQNLKPSQEKPRLDKKPGTESNEKSNEKNDQEPTSQGGVPTPGQKNTPDEDKTSPNRRQDPSQEESTVDQTPVTESSTNYGENPTSDSTSNKDSTPGMKSTPNQAGRRPAQNLKPSQEKPRLDKKPGTESTEKSNEKISEEPTSEGGVPTPGQKITPDKAHTSPNQRPNPSQEISTHDQTPVTESTKTYGENPTSESTSNEDSTPGKKSTPNQAGRRPDQNLKPSQERPRLDKKPGTESIDKSSEKPSSHGVPTPGKKITPDKAHTSPNRRPNPSQEESTFDQTPVTESNTNYGETPSSESNKDSTPGMKSTSNQAKTGPDQNLKPSQEKPRMDKKPGTESIDKSNQQPSSERDATPGEKNTPDKTHTSPNRRPNPSQEESTFDQTPVTESNANYGENPSSESTSNKNSTPGMKSTPNQVEPELDYNHKPNQERPRLDNKPGTESVEKSSEKPSSHGVSTPGQKMTPDRGETSQNQRPNPGQETSTVNQTPGQKVTPDEAETRPDEKFKPDQEIQTLNKDAGTEFTEKSDKNPPRDPLSRGVSTPGKKITPDGANTPPNERPNPNQEILTVHQTPVTESIERSDKNPLLEPTFTDDSTTSEKSTPDRGYIQPEQTHTSSRDVPTTNKKTDKSGGSSSPEPTTHKDSTPGQKITPDQAKTSPNRKTPSQKIPTVDQTDVTESMEKAGKDPSPELHDLKPGGKSSPDSFNPQLNPKFKPSQTKPSLDEKPVTESTRITDEATILEPKSHQEETPGQKLPPDQINTDERFGHRPKIPIYDQNPETEPTENSDKNPPVKPSSNQDSSTGKKLTPNRTNTRLDQKLKPNQRIPTLNQKPVTESIGKPSSHGNSTSGKKIVPDRAKTRPDQRFRPSQKVPTLNEKPVSESIDISRENLSFRPTSDPESGPEPKFSPDRGNTPPDKKFTPQQKIPNLGKKNVSKSDKRPTFKPTTDEESTPGRNLTRDGVKTQPDQKPGQKIPRINEESDIKPSPDSTSNEDSTAGREITPDQTSPKQKQKPNLKIPKNNQKYVTESTKNSENPSSHPATNEGFPPEQKITTDRTNTRTELKLKPNQRIPKITQKPKPGPISKPNQKIPKPVTDLRTKPNVTRKTDHSPQTNQRPKPPQPNLNPKPASDEISKPEADKTSKQRPPSRFRPPVGPGATPVKRPKPAVLSEPSPKTETRLDPPPLISWTTSDGIQNSQTDVPPVSGPGKQIAEMTHSPEAGEFTPNTRKTVTPNPKTSNSLETGTISHRHTLLKDFTESPNSRIQSDLKPQTTSKPPSIMHEIFPNVVSSSHPGSTKPNVISRSDSKSFPNVEEGASSVPTPSPGLQTLSTLRPGSRSTTPATSGLQPPAAESSTPSARELRVKINQVAAFLNNSLSPNGETTQVRPSKQQPEDTQGGSRPDRTEQPPLIPSKGPTVRRDCSDHLLRGARRTGVYLVTPDLRSRSFRVFCDMDLDGGGWTVLQRRQDGSVSFNRTWAEYRSGFGELDGGEFWLGNTGIHLLTRERDMELRVELEDFEGVEEYANYEQFRVAGERLRYRLTVGGYSGTAGDALRFNKRYDHNGRAFTTPDRDHDRYPSGNCGAYYSSGWWFDACMAANLNGRYYQGSYKGVRDGIYWGTWHNISSEYYPTNDRQSFRRVRMMIRPKGFRS